MISRRLKDGHDEDDGWQGNDCDYLVLDFAEVDRIPNLLGKTAGTDPFDTGPSAALKY